MITDVIREVRETMRIREEALVNRMKSMIDERSWSLNEANIRTSRELEELKVRLQLQLAGGSIFANPPKVGTMGSPIPANFFFVILCLNCSNFFF
jgi:hypothetical protein